MSLSKMVTKHSDNNGQPVSTSQIAKVVPTPAPEPTMRPVPIGLTPEQVREQLRGEYEIATKEMVDSSNRKRYRFKTMVLPHIGKFTVFQGDDYQIMTLSDIFSEFTLTVSGENRDAVMAFAEKNFLLLCYARIRKIGVCSMYGPCRYESWIDLPVTDCP